MWVVTKMSVCMRMSSIDYVTNYRLYNEWEKLSLAIILDTGIIWDEPERALNT